jgi:hypothetical protein
VFCSGGVNIGPFKIIEGAMDPCLVFMKKGLKT